MKPQSRALDVTEMNSQSAIQSDQRRAALMSSFAQQKGDGDTKVTEKNGVVSDGTTSVAPIQNKFKPKVVGDSKEFKESNMSFSYDQWQKWNKTASATNVTVTANMYTIILDYFHQLNTISLELGRQNTNYARVRGMATDLFRTTRDNKRALGYIADASYTEIIKQLRGTILVKNMLKLVIDRADKQKTQYKSLFEKEGVHWGDTARVVSLHKQSYVYQTQLIEEQRKATIVAKSLYDSWLDKHYQDSMLDSNGNVVTADDQLNEMGDQSNEKCKYAKMGQCGNMQYDECAEFARTCTTTTGLTNTQIREMKKAQANEWLDNVTNMQDFFPIQGPAESCAGTKDCKEAMAKEKQQAQDRLNKEQLKKASEAGAFSQTGQMEETWVHDEVVRKTIEKVKNHPMSLLAMHDMHYQKHGRFRRVMNEKLEQTVHDMIDDAHKLRKKWERQGHYDLGEL